MKPNRYLLLLAAWTLAVGLTAERIVTIYRSDPQIAAVNFLLDEEPHIVNDEAYLNTIVNDEAPWSRVEVTSITDSHGVTWTWTSTSNTITGYPSAVTSDRLVPLKMEAK